MNKRCFATIVLVAFVLAACGSPPRTSGGATRSGPAGGAGPDAPVSSTPGGNTAGKGAAEISPSEGLVDVRRQPWDSVRVLPNDRALEVLFYGGVKACYGLDRYEVSYERHRVVVALFAGRKPGADVCIEIAKRYTFRIPLSEPVGGRRIVDASGR